MTPGQITYEAYCRSMQGTVIVPWHVVVPDSRCAWEASAQAVLEARASLCPICHAALARCNAQEDETHA